MRVHTQDTQNMHGMCLVMSSVVNEAVLISWQLYHSVQKVRQ